MSDEMTLESIASRIRNCTSCPLHNFRKNSVPGAGPSNAEILFIGEAPGFYENEQGKPFVGQAGKLLDELLMKIGIQRNSIFITNVVKCRPPENRDPLPDELEACNSYLEQQIKLLDPKVIVTLGRISMGKFLASAKISLVHGQAFSSGGRLVVPMYHPAAALHQPSLRPQLEADFLKLPGYISRNGSAAAEKGNATPANSEKKKEAPKDEPTQPSLF